MDQIENEKITPPK